MNDKKQHTGIGETQINQTKIARASILKVLADRKPHQYSELKKQTGLSSATLSKHLKQLKKTLEKKVDTTSGKYPYPVYYTLNMKYGQLTKEDSDRNAIINRWSAKLESALRETEKPKFFLEFLNGFTNLTLLNFLKAMKTEKEEGRSIDYEELNLGLSYGLLEAFEVLTWNFLITAEPILKSIDIDKLIKEQMQKSVESYSRMLAATEKKEQT